MARFINLHDTKKYGEHKDFLAIMKDNKIRKLFRFDKAGVKVLVT